MKHLFELIEKFSKDKHNLCEPTLNPVVRQNFDSFLRMTDKKVIDLLKSNVKGSQATMKFLQIMRDVVDTYMDISLTPLERINKIWYSIFVLRIWRKFVLEHKELTLKDNFLTQNCYICVELNAHSLLLCMHHLKEEKKEQFFKPDEFNSQWCENMFRCLRSFTTVYSTKTNCTVKEMISRIHKVQLQNEISLNDVNFAYPRSVSAKKYAEKASFELPTMETISDEIEKCKKKAIFDALKLGILTKSKSKNNDLFKCETNPYRSQKKAKKLYYVKNNAEKLEKEKRKIQIIQGIYSIKDYSNIIRSEEVTDVSPYVIIKCVSGNKIIKKTSLCWLLRPETQRISSDRLLRVRVHSKKAKNKHLIYGSLSKRSKKSNKQKFHM